MSYQVAREPDGVSDAMPLVLLHKMGLQVGVFFAHKILDFVAHIPDYKNKLLYTGFGELVNEYAEDGFASQRNQCLGLGVGVWTQFGAGTCYRNDRFHRPENTYFCGKFYKACNKIPLSFR